MLGWQRDGIESVGAVSEATRRKVKDRERWSAAPGRFRYSHLKGSRSRLRQTRGPTMGIESDARHLGSANWLWNGAAVGRAGKVAASVIATGRRAIHGTGEPAAGRAAPAGVG